MKAENFFIKDGYKVQPYNATLRDDDDAPYWDKTAIKLNSYFQYHCYLEASKLFKKQNLKSVCDIGCGAGVKLNKFFNGNKSTVFGIDQKHAIEFCQERYKDSGINFKIDNFEEPSLTDLPKFDMIISSDVIEHLVNPNILLNYIKTISNKDTLIVLSTPERDKLRGKDNFCSNKPEHIREWNQEEFLKYLDYMNFDVIETRILPFAKFSLNKTMRFTRKVIKSRTGTTNTMHYVVCKIRNT